jgi:flagellin-like protein
MMNKKGVSPLIATILLIVFSLILGTITMNLGKAYIEDITEVGAAHDAPDNKDMKYIDNNLYKCIKQDDLTKTCLEWALVLDQ